MLCAILMLLTGCPSTGGSAPATPVRTPESVLDRAAQATFCRLYTPVDPAVVDEATLANEALFCALCDRAVCPASVVEGVEQRLEARYGGG
jgi:hypothetical protein